MADSALCLEGGCDCGRLRYRLEAAPLFVHCCHCRWCQRETGSAFAHNALIESTLVSVLRGSYELIRTPTASGKPQYIARCPFCRIALWSHYASLGAVLSFVRVGTLDDPNALPPKVHIFTDSKQHWLALPPDAPATPQFYRREQHWPPASLARREALLPAMETWQEAYARGEELIPLIPGALARISGTEEPAPETGPRCCDFCGQSFLESELHRGRNAAICNACALVASKTLSQDSEVIGNA